MDVAFSAQLDYLHFIQNLFSCNRFTQRVSSRLEINHQI